MTHLHWRRAVPHAVTMGIAVCLAALAAAAPALGYSTVPGYTASDYATGFPMQSPPGWGPLGLAFDQSYNLFVANVGDAHIYRFQPGGGTASAATRLSGPPIAGTIRGLAFTSDGRLYLARTGAGDVAELDPATGTLVRSAAAVKCATGLAVDPISGDLFVSQPCASTISRVSGLSHGPVKVSIFASVGGSPDGIAFASDGTLYAATSGRLQSIGGTTAPHPGTVHDVTGVPLIDGLAPGVSGGRAFILGNRQDGILTKIDLSASPASQTNIFSGGTRGDFATTDSHGCLYITQASSIVKVAPASGSCQLSQTTPGPTPKPGVTLETQTTRTGTSKGTKGGRCVALRSVSLRLRQRGGSRITSAVVYLSGKRIKSVNGAAVSATITLTHLPSGSFTVKIVAKTAAHRTTSVTRRYTNCNSATTKRRGAKKHHTPHKKKR